MKKWRFITLSLLFVSQSLLFAQSEKDLIIQTLNNYIEGTSYSRTEQIQKAFHEASELFLDGKEKNSLRIVPSKEYISYFTKRPNQFTGRVGDLLSIDYFGNIAMAKAEILIPAAQKRFVDMFILKKVEGEWKIISKTANSEKSDKKGERVLFIVSNAHFYGDSDIPTGNSFGEIVTAYDVLDQAGYTVDFVSPEGGAIPLAYINTADALQKKYLYQPDLMYRLKNTLSPDQTSAEKYKAVYYVGGGSAMFEVPTNEGIHQLVMQIYEEQKGIISAVCHGTAGIVHLKTKDGQYLVNGKKINGYPDAYERKEADYYQEFPFAITQTIESHGGEFKYAPRNTPHVEVDGKVITGQNHLSSKGVAEAIVAQLEKEGDG